MEKKIKINCQPKRKMKKYVQYVFEGMEGILQQNLPKIGTLNFLDGHFMHAFQAHFRIFGVKMCVDGSESEISLKRFS
jgi:hypothetical protein